jgi:hypothetical protein
MYTHRRELAHLCGIDGFTTAIDAIAAREIN